VAAAIETIAELGYGQASLARIAETAGTSKGVIIYHFGSKDNLIRELVAELSAKGRAWIGPRLEAEATGPGMLRAYMEANMSFIRENRNHVAAVVEIALNARSADGSPLYDTSVREEGAEALRQILVYFQGTGEFRADFGDPARRRGLRGRPGHPAGRAGAAGPSWMVDIANVFPVRHLAAALLTAYNPHTTGAGFAGTDLLIVALWGIGGLAFALWRFSWVPLGR
jgi:AcrR family transcriptional regulator